MKLAFAVTLVCGCASRDPQGARISPAPAAPAAVVTPTAPAPAARAVVPRGSVTVGEHHTCAVTATAGVACWGQGGNGRLGTPGNTDELVPTAVPGLTDIAGVASGADVTCAWTAHGAAWCWGNDEGNRAGDHRPRQVPGVHDVVQIVAGYDGACGLRHTGRVVCWSRDAWSDPLWPPPYEVVGLADAVEIAGDDRRLCARTSGGDVMCMELKDTRQDDLRDQVATVLPELHGATSLAGIDELFAALLPDHRLATWDLADLEGRVTPAANEPIRITQIDGTAPPSGGAAGRGQAPTGDGERVVIGGTRRGPSEVCVIGARTRCWAAGELSAHNSDPPARPRVIDQRLQDLAIGDQVSCARVDDHLECWGLIGRLGDGTSELPTEFVPVKDITDAVQLEAGLDTTCVRRATGHVACWGARDIAMTADGKPIIDYAPNELAGVDDAVEIAMSYDTVCARRRSGGTTCWTTARNGVQTPVASRELATATRLLSSASEVCGVDASGALACRPAAIPAMQNDATVIAELAKNLAAGRPCATDARNDSACWHGAGAIATAFTQNYGVECVVRGGKIACHSGTDTKDTNDPLPDQAHVVSYDGTYALTADGHVVTTSSNAPVAKLRSVVEVRAGARTVCARRRGGRVWCWGERDYLGAGQRGTPGDPIAVQLALGSPRPFAPEAVVTPAIVPPPPGPTRSLTGTPMRGPFADRERACRAIACPIGHTRDCGGDPGPRAMLAPPPPFTEIGLMSIDCRDPADSRDGSETFRLLVKRGDGYWLSGVLFGAGGNDHYCGASIETRWSARPLVAGGAPAPVLDVLARTSCHNANGGDDDDHELLIAAANAKRPQWFAPIAIGEGTASSSTHLDAAFAPDGTLAIGGAAVWAPKRPTPIGTYRFVTR